MVYPPVDGHPSKYQPGPAYSNFIDRDNQRVTDIKPRKIPKLFLSDLIFVHPGNFWRPVRISVDGNVVIYTDSRRIFNRRILRNMKFQDFWLQFPGLSSIKLFSDNCKTRKQFPQLSVRWGNRESVTAPVPSFPLPQAGLTTNNSRKNGVLNTHWPFLFITATLVLHREGLLVVINTANSH